MNFANSFPREVGVPRRRLVKNIDDYISFVNTYNTKQNIYSTIYSFREIDGDQVKYNSCNLDKLFFDIDSKDFVDGEVGAFKEVLKLHNACVERNLMHSVLFSGRGFHFYMYTKNVLLKNPKWALFNAQDAVQQSLQLKCEPAIKGDIARIARIPNTLNLRCGRFAIPLTEKQLNGDIKDIIVASSKQQIINDYILGKRLFDMTKYDTEPKLQYAQIEFDNIDLGDDGLNMLIDTVPNCMKALMGNKDCNYRQRFHMILYLREKFGLGEKEITEILKQILSEKKFKHCLYNERQVVYVCQKRTDLFFPNCDTLIAEGYCPGQCDKYPNCVYRNGVRK